MKRAWAFLFLGTLQISGASLSVYMLATTGASGYTIAGVAATLCTTLVSILLKTFVWRKPPQ